MGRDGLREAMGPGEVGAQGPAAEDLETQVERAREQKAKLTLLLERSRQELVRMRDLLKARQDSGEAAKDPSPRERRPWTSEERFRLMEGIQKHGVSRHEADQVAGLVGTRSIPEVQIYTRKILHEAVRQKKRLEQEYTRGESNTDTWLHLTVAGFRPRAAPEGPPEGNGCGTDGEEVTKEEEIAWCREWMGDLADQGLPVPPRRRSKPRSGHRRRRAVARGPPHQPSPDTREKENAEPGSPSD